MMKIKKTSQRIFAVLLAISLLVGNMLFCVNAAESDSESVGGQSGDFKYALSDDGTAKITEYTGSDTLVTIPSTLDGYKVTSIGNYAFFDCSSLESITIPDSITSIDARTFWSCTSHKSINVDSNNESFASEDGVLFNKAKTELIKYPEGKEIEEYLVPDTVNEISDFAFEYSETLKSVIMSDGVTKIGNSTFLYSKNLQSVTIPDSVTEIGGSAFLFCTNLKSVTIPDSVTAMGGYAFACCDSLESVIISNSLTIIDDHTFSNCTSLKSVVLPDSITNIGECAFDECSSLKTITVPAGVSIIENQAFCDCISLESITVHSDNANYASDDGVLFNKDKTYLIQYPAGKKLSHYSVPDSVICIGNQAFEKCTFIKNIIIPNSVEYIESNAFFVCPSLESINIPDSVAYIGFRAFNKCSSLKSIDVSSNNANYTSEDGVLFNKDKSYLIKYPGGNARKEYYIPDSVTSIDEFAFQGCTKLESISIPESITSIGMGLFGNCTALKNITVPGSVTSIDDMAFENCTSLKSITIPDSVTSIGMWAFVNCDSLKSVTISDSVTSIGDWAFGYIEHKFFEYEAIKGFSIYGTAGSAAENYASDNGFVFMDVNAVMHKDDSTGISLTAKADASLAVSIVTDEQSVNNANALLGDAGTVINLYDISLIKDGEKVQPEGMAEIKIPCNSKNGKIFCLKSDNTITETDSYYQDGFIVCHSDSLGRYILASTTSLGDMNDDGKIDVTDVTAIQIELAMAGSDYYDRVADTDSDGKVTVADVTHLQQFIAGAITKL